MSNLLLLTLFLLSETKQGEIDAFSSNFEELKNGDIKISALKKRASERFDSLNMRFVSNWPSGPSHTTEIDSARGLVFCGSGGGVYILQVSDTSTPIKLSEKIHTRDVVKGLFYQEDSRILYLAANEDGLIVWNIDYPLNPMKLGSYVTPGNAVDVVVSGNYAHVINEDTNDKTVRIIDISNPSTPTEVGHYDTPGDTKDLTVSGDYAYVADGDSGLRIIDISTPSSPYEVGFYDTTGTIIDVAISGNYAYLACNMAGVRVIDISTPSSPSEVGRYHAADSRTKGVEISGSHLYLADEKWGEYELDEHMWPYCDPCLRIIDISTPSNPTQIGVWYTGYASDPPSGLKGLFASGNYASLFAWGNLYVIDISNPLNPERKARINFNNGEELVISGNYTYLVKGFGGLSVIDISTSNLKEVGHFGSSAYLPWWWAYNIAVSGNYAYVTYPYWGFRILDISTPSNPSEAGARQIGGALHIAVSGNYVYLVASREGLQILDISTLSNPTLVGQCDTPGAGRDVAISGSYAYVADGDFGLQVIDISNPSNPTIVASYDTPHNARNVTISSTYAYVADEASGLRVVDISNPLNPEEISSYAGTGNIVDVAISDSYAYVIDDNTNDVTIRTIDISMPSNLSEVGYYNTPGNITDIAISDNYIYVTNGNFGLQIYENLLLRDDEEDKEGFLKVTQNPFMEATEVQIDGWVPFPATLNVYDIAGRIREQIVIHNSSPVTIGADLNSGIYFVGGKGFKSAKVIKLK